MTLGGETMDDSRIDVDDSRSILAEFVAEQDVTELAVVDDLWYFIKKGGNWIAGSG